jgi:hypothetical protein
LLAKLGVEDVDIWGQSYVEEGTEDRPTKPAPAGFENSGLIFFDDLVKGTEYCCIAQELSCGLYVNFWFDM